MYPSSSQIVYWEDSVGKMWKEFQANCQGNILEEDWCFFTKGTKEAIEIRWKGEKGSDLFFGISRGR